MSALIKGIGNGRQESARVNNSRQESATVGNGKLHWITKLEILQFVLAM